MYYYNVIRNNNNNDDDKNDLVQMTVYLNPKDVFPRG